VRLLIILIITVLKTALSADHFNILIYHHVSESTPASTSVSPAVFREHLQFFKDNNITVLQLDTALEAIKSGEPLPDKSIAITFDDGYKNIFDNAMPLLKEFGFPFTVFVATDPIDKGFGDMLTWDQLREMKKQGVIIANHSTDHGYLVRHRQRDVHWLAATKENINAAQRRLEEELGSDIPKWFAYPYGEFNTELQQQIKEMGYIGFAQHSGGVWSGSHMQALPRFAAAGIYSKTKTLKTKIESHPMPVNESSLPDMITAEQQPSITVSLLDSKDLNKALNCFVDGAWQEADWINDLNFSLATNEALSEGRHRYNCTSKSKTSNYYYWFSKPWLVYLPEK